MEMAEAKSKSWPRRCGFACAMKLNNCNHLLTFLAWGQSCFDEKTNSISFLLLQYILRKHKFQSFITFQFTFFHTKSREIVGHFISIRRNAFWNGNRNISLNCCSIARKDSVKPAKPLINFWKKRATRQFLTFLTKTLIQVFMFVFQYREERFRQTSESTNSRVLWWSLGQTCILLVMGAWQMRHLKSFFEAKKLV